MLKQQRKEYCENTKETAFTELGKQLIAGTDPLSSTLPTKANGVTVDFAANLDQSGFLGGGSCFADKSVSLMGATVSLPFSSVCPYLLPLRYALMIAAMMAAFRMVSGSVLREG